MRGAWIMKGRILEILRNNVGTVSGEILSQKLGTSRVSIWKHIHKLKELGYDISSTPKGYQLTETTDTLFPWEFAGREENIHHFSEVSSTMDIARDLARKGCPGFTTVIAEKQLKGRGRLKRTWFSSTGGLYFTMVLRPKIPSVISARVNFAASLVLAKTLRRLFHIDARVKWPNDILVEERKLVGMLSEMEAEADILSFINIGLGINVNNDPTLEEPNAVSLKEIIGKNVSRKNILVSFLDEFEALITDNNLENIIPEWKKYTITLNRKVKIVTTNDISEGIARDVDENGALILELNDGSMKKVLYGDCFHR
jgi:BirA family transcriptional regulator, biotin operon repressor / biotin---[acetyl-CoA-carboxylase] ligase